METLSNQELRLTPAGTGTGIFLRGDLAECRVGTIGSSIQSHALSCLKFPNKRCRANANFSAAFLARVPPRARAAAGQCSRVRDFRATSVAKFVGGLNVRRRRARADFRRQIHRRPMRFFRRNVQKAEGPAPFRRSPKLRGPLPGPCVSASRQGIGSLGVASPPGGLFPNRSRLQRGNGAPPGSYSGSRSSRPLPQRGGN